MSGAPGRHRRRWFCYMGPFAVPTWLFALSPLWLHEFARLFGGVE